MPDSASVPTASATFAFIHREQQLADAGVGAGVEGLKLNVAVMEKGEP
jgi:hypothetical protein